MTRSQSLLACTAAALALASTPALAQSPVLIEDEVVTTSPDIELELIGRVMLDQTFASADEADVNFNTSDARRLRIGVKGNYGDDVKFKLELNTDSSGDINAEDAYVQWYPTGDSWSVIVGQDNTHNSFDELTSSIFVPFAERSFLTDTFQLDRRLGVSLLDQGDNWTAAVGLHTVNLENAGDEEGWAASARVTGTPVNTDDLLLHLGASWRYRDQGSSDDLLRYRQRPMSGSLNRIISTGRVAEEDNFYGVEAVASLQDGKFWLASEYTLTEAESTVGGIADDASFSGGYLTAGTMLGGRRTYKNGTWKRPKIDNPVGSGGYGALLVEARYDRIDLEDDPVDGGELDGLAIAADWYLTKYSHIGVTAFTSDAELGTSTSGLGSPFSNLVTAGFEEEDVSGIVIRAQFDWGVPVGKF